MVRNIGIAPIQNMLAKNSGPTEMVWSSFFTTLADSLKGDWGEQIPPDAMRVATFSDGELVLQETGATSIINAWYNEVVGAGEIELPYEVKETILMVWDNGSNTLIGGCKAENAKITLPLLTGQDIIITGNLIKV
jgi:hypothetical protein